MSEKRFGYDGKVWGPKFARGWGKDKLPEPRLLKFVEDFKKEIGPKILDIGSGIGRHSIPLAQMGYEVTGLEVNEEGRVITRNKEKEANVRTEMVGADFRELPFREGAFDTVVCTSTLHHNNWDGLVQSFAEATRVLKSGGLFFLKIRSDRKPIKPHEKQIEDKGRTTMMVNEDGKIEYHHDLSREEIDELAKINNLTVENEPVDEFIGKDGKPALGHWNIIFRKNLEDEKSKE